MNPLMTEAGVKSKTYAAIDKLLLQDRALFILNANERSISHRLALYLQEQFPDWHVDCEYNRNNNDPKIINWKPSEVKKRQVSSDDTTGQTVYPDIIVHHRRTSENLLVIEMKLTTNRQASGTDDKLKLEAYKRDLGYEYALFICFEAKDKSGIVCEKWL